MPFDWKITRDHKKQQTMLEVLDPKGGAVVTGTGKDIWEARENALTQTRDIEVQNYITRHLWPDIE
jgi:hypothetical protein